MDFENVYRTKRDPRSICLEPVGDMIVRRAFISCLFTRIKFCLFCFFVRMYKWMNISERKYKRGKEARKKKRKGAKPADMEQSEQWYHK